MRGNWLSVGPLCIVTKIKYIDVFFIVGFEAGGNPGDLCPLMGGTTCQPYFEVSGLLAGDSFDMTWSLDGSQILGPDLIPDFPTLDAGSK